MSTKKNPIEALETGKHNSPLKNSKISYTFTDPINYRAYLARTDEKLLLQQELFNAYINKELPIGIGDVGKKILDLGCEIGTHTSFLADLFKSHEIHAIDVSDSFIKCTKKRIIANDHVSIDNIAFEDFSVTDYDFILASHVLQYIRTPLVSFIKKIIEHLAYGGEAWVVLQEEEGINSIVQAGKPYMKDPSPYFSNWFVHDKIRRILYDQNIVVKPNIINSNYICVDFDKVTPTDLNFLNFVLLGGYDINNLELNTAIANAQKETVHDKYVTHKIGISKIRKIS